MTIRSRLSASRSDRDNARVRHAHCQPTAAFVPLDLARTFESPGARTGLATSVGRNPLPRFASPLNGPKPTVI
jgi:hypothetical protein